MKRFLMATVALAAVTTPALASTIRVAINQDLRTSQPGVNRDGNSDIVLTHVVEGLVSYNEGRTVGPLLAESYSLSDDGKTYTFKLRKGLKFHNGEPLTSADVKWSFDYYLNPKTGWYCIGEMDGSDGTKVVSYDAPDPDTFVIQIEKPDAMFLETMSRTDCGGTAIIHKASLKADGTWDKPIGTGPFKFGDWKRGQSVQFDKFDDYVSRSDKPDGFVGKKDPLVDTAIFMAVPDGATVKAGLQSGDIDVAAVPESDVVELKDNAELTITHGTTLTRNAFILQTRDPLLKDERIRQALALALDYKEIVAAVTDGLGQVNNSPVYPSSRYFGDVEKQGFEYNPEKARQLLKEAGYNGQEIVLDCNKRSTVPSFPMSVIAQQMWQAVGLNVRLEVLDWPAQLELYGKGDYMMQAMSFSPRFDVASGFEQLSGNRDKQPRKIWENPAALELLEKAQSTLDPEIRQPIFDEMHTMILKDVPIILTHNDVLPLVHNKKIAGVTNWISPVLVWNVSKQD